MNRLATALMLILMIAGCAKTPVTGRSQLILISNEQEISLGLSESEKLKQSAKLSTDKAQTERIRRIGKRIAAVSGRDDFQWEFNVIESDTLNAFCLPGGKVYFYTGLLKLTANDDQIATVMGHEIAHALARHGAERMSMQMVSNTGGQLLGAAMGVPAEYQGLYSQAYGLSTQLGVLLPYSRKHESEADQIGIYLMWKAGFDPNQAVAFWQKMKEASGGKKAPEFLSTHPSDQSRIDAIRAFVKSLPEER
ncbi:M48 family metallopeptidase [Sulfurimonas sp. HSL1-2]|uniref:M48 family metallopeptidase n=1 Tax=Thiomicrolovo zhangzhouensis TaxID=3131933 RepID=UPI0031F8F946